MIDKTNSISDLDELLKKYKDNYSFIESDFLRIYSYIFNNKKVGFIIFNIIYERCEILDIFVLEEYRRKNIAENLIKEVIKDYNVENITLEVNVNNIAAINLYEKLGFKKVSIRKKYYKDSDGILMLKEVR